MIRSSFARWVSIIGHPFALLLLYVVAGASVYLPWQQAAVATAIVFFVAILPLSFYLYRQAKTGATNFDVSAQELRGPVYGMGLALGLVLVAVFYGLGAPLNLLGALLVGVGMVVVASLVNLKLKVSLHSAFAVWVAFGLWQFHPRLGTALIALAALVVWSRLELCRHTRAEVVAGVTLGALMSIPLYFLS